MPEKQEQNKRILGILSQTAKDIIKVGEKDYKLYPISLGKLDLLAKHENAIKDLMSFISSQDKNVSESETREKMEAAFDGAAELFHILTTPNTGEEIPELTPEEKKKLRWTLSTQNLFQIQIYLQTAHFPGDLLKNVGSPRQNEESPIGETS